MSTITQKKRYKSYKAGKTYRFGIELMPGADLIKLQKQAKAKGFGSLSPYIRHILMEHANIETA